MMTKLESSPKPADLSRREAEILDAVDVMLRAHDEWENDPKTGSIPPRSFELALLYAAEVCDSGDVPARCRDICTVAMPRLKYEWDRYNEGQRRHDGTPMPQLWAAYRAVLSARELARPFVPKQREPIYVLHRQGLNAAQILMIWPEFRRADGMPDLARIQREIDNPGSEISLDTLSPDELARKEAWDKTVERRIVATNTLEANESARYVDPAPIEDLIRQGLRPEVIAQVKRVTLKEVYAAGKTAGLTMPDMGPSIPPHAPIPMTPPERGPARTEERTEDPEALRQADDGTGSPEAADIVRQLHFEGHGVPEIAAKLPEFGFKLPQKQIAKLITKLKKETVTNG